MLPSYREKMSSRHTYANGNGGHPGGGGAYPMSPTFVESRGKTLNIRPDKYEKYHPRSARSALHRRKGLFLRLTCAVALLFFLLGLFFPSLRPAALLSALALPFTSGDEWQIETVRYYDLANVAGTSRGWEREERILLCAPLRDASPHLPMFFSHLRNLTYPHNLIDLAFLVGDSKDNTLQLLSNLLAELQAAEDPRQTFGEISVIEKDFGQKVNQDVESRHGFAAQAGRRKSMAQARNWLLSAALRPTHSWVYWRDVDVETAPFTILEDLMRHNKDIIVPNVWRPLPDWLGGEQPYDLNSWQESDTALALADTLDEDAVIVEGYAEYATWRPHLAYLRDPYGDPDMEMEIDGVGGVSILAKASVFRSGVHFPAFSFEKHAETEGFGKMAKRMGFSVVGLPHYTIWHLYEPSVDDIRHMEEMEQERKQREEEEKKRKERAERVGEQFDVEGTDQWAKDKAAVEEVKKGEEKTKKKAVKAEEKEEEKTEKKAAKEGEEEDDQKKEKKAAKQEEEEGEAKTKPVKKGDKTEEETEEEEEKGTSKTKQVKKGDNTGEETEEVEKGEKTEKTEEVKKGKKTEDTEEDTEDVKKRETTGEKTADKKAEDKTGEEKTANKKVEARTGEKAGSRKRYGPDAV